MNRTDLALEIAVKRSESDGITLEKSIMGKLPLTRVTVSEKGENIIGKPAGEYLTLFCNDRDEEAEVDALSEILSGLISKFVSHKGRILVAGLGNENITPDSLGVRAVSRIAATAHFAETEEFDELGMREIAVVETGVLAQTGIESAVQLKYIADGFKPDLILAVDSLACLETDRLGRTIQVTDTGIAPGSGVKNSRKEISARVFNIPVVAVGVPTINIMRVCKILLNVKISTILNFLNYILIAVSRGCCFNISKKFAVIIADIIKPAQFGDFNYFFIALN